VPHSQHTADRAQLPTTEYLTAHWRHAHWEAVGHLNQARFTRCGCTVVAPVCAQGQTLVEIADDAAERLALAGDSIGHELRHWHADDVACRGEFGAVMRCVTARCGFSAPCTQTPLTDEEASTGRWLCPDCREEARL
jgi:hypothetical protein